MSQSRLLFPFSYVLNWGSHIYDGKFHSMSDVTPSLVSNMSKIIFNVNPVCVLIVLTCKSQKNGNMRRLFFAVPYKSVSIH